METNRIISTIFIIMSLIIMVIVIHVYPEEQQVPVEENLYYEYNIVERVLPNDYNSACSLLESAESRLDAANRLADVLAELGYIGDHPAAALAQAEIINATENVNYYAYHKEELKWKMYSSDYFNATYVWRALKNQGWNDYVCAGIMGNIMAECGGQTLNINPYRQTDIYYGICQWNPGYTAVQGKNLDFQCQFLIDTLEKTMNKWGYLYSSDMNFENFLNLQDVEEVAKCFAQCYERCASYTYGVRQKNAIKAYNYFVR